MKPYASTAGSIAIALVVTAMSHADPVGGAWFEWDAVQNPGPGTTWPSTTGNAYDWTFDAGSQTAVDVADARFDMLTKAYAFPGARDENSGTFDGLGSPEKATFEFVLDPDTDDGLIFESGGTGDGIEFYLAAGVLRGYIREGTPPAVSYTLTSDDKNRFMHCVFVVDNAGAVFQLYVDGEPKDSASWTGGTDWSGSDAAGLGGSSSSIAEDNVDPGDISGKIAIFRYYRNKAFTAEEVRQNFLSLSSAGIWSGLVVTNVSGTSAWATATLNTNVSSAVLVWDTLDQGTDDTNAWSGSSNLGGQGAGSVTGQATGLVADAAYTYRFRGEYDATNEWSQPGTFATALTVAQTPVFTNATGASHSTIELRWQDNAATETDYVLRRADAASGPYTGIATLPADTVAYTDSGLSPSTEYFYRLAATNAANGSVTDFAACQTRATTGMRLATPQVDDSGSATVNGIQNSFTLTTFFDAAGSDKLVVTASMERDRADVNTRIASVTYNDIPMTEVIQFKNYDEGPAAIYYLDNPGTGGPIVANGYAKMNGAHGSWLAISGTATGVGVSTTTTDVSTSLTTLLNSSLVVAHNHVNAGTVPQAQPPLTALLQSNGQYSEAAAGFQIVDEAGTVTPTFSAGLTPVTVAAVFEPFAVIGQIIWSSPGTSNITVTSGWTYVTVNTNLDELVLVWDTSDKGTSNTADWAYSRGLGAASAGVVTGEATNLLADTEYMWRFYGTNAFPTNGWSPARSLATDLTSAQTPVFTSATSPEYTRVELGWQDYAATETGYVLRRSETGVDGPYVAIATLSANTTAYTDRDVLASSTYHYQLAATNVINGSSTAFGACRTQATTGEAPPGLLFADTFDRPDSTDLNASRVGKSGILGTLNYTTRTFDAVVLDINNNSMRMNGPASDGNYGGLVYIHDHNFIDATILRGGGFSISVDISAYSTAGSGRYMGIGVGQSLAELDGQTGVGPARSPGDLFVGFRQTTDALEIFRNGVQDIDASVTGGVPDAPTTMRIEYSFFSFSAGSTVDYGVFFDDSETPLTAGSFTWSGGDENYISFSSNLSNDNRFDNLEIRANPALAAPGMTIIVK